MSIKNWLCSGFVAAGLLAVGGTGSQVHALGIDGVYTLNVCGGGASLISCGPYGTVTISGDQTASLSYAYSVSGGARIHGTNNLGSGNSTLVEQVSGNISSTVVFSNTSFAYAVDPSPGSDGLQASANFEAQQCTGSVASGNPCGTTVTVTFAALSGILTAQSWTTNGFTIFAGVDVTCNRAAGATCPLTQFGGGETGLVGATATAVPLPLAGAGLPGLIVACGAMLALARRRRTAQLV